MPQLDLFGEVIPEAGEENNPTLDLKIAEDLLQKKIPTLGPSHRIKSKDESGKPLYRDGSIQLWLPPRGDAVRKVMVIGYHPADHDLKQKTILIGPTGVKLEKALREKVGIRLNDCYLTNLVKYHFPPGVSVPKEAVNLCMPYLKKEIEDFKPDLILCLGSEVFGHITGYDGGIDDYRGSRFKHDDYDALLAVVWLPTVVLNNPEQEEIWINDLKSVFQKHNVDATTNWEEQDSLPTHFVTNIQELKVIVDKIIGDKAKEFALDTEFDGETWYDSNCFKLDISTAKENIDLHFLEPTQGYDPIIYPATKGRHKFSEDPEIAERWLFNTKEEEENYIKDHPFRTKPLASYIREYTWVFDGTEAQVAHELNRLFQREDVEVWGHNGRVDFKLLLRMGVNLFDRIKMDTITLALHLHESQPLGLEDITKRYLGAPNHKLPLIHWLKTNQVTGGKLPYSFVPRKIIDPYAVTDSRRTFDLKAELMKELDIQDRDALQKNEPSLRHAYEFYKMGQFKSLTEMEIIGQPIALDALKTNIEWYEEQRKKQRKLCIEKVCKATGWTNFNPGSITQVRKLLFEELKLTPLYSTDKPPVPWEKIALMEPEEQAGYTPSTNQETLETLALDSELCAELNNTRLLATLSKHYLRRGARWKEEKPKVVEKLELWAQADGDYDNLDSLDTEEEEEEDEDNEVEESFWEASEKDKKSRALSQVVNTNGFLYSSYFELLETHRLATKPNISAVPKGESRYIQDITGIAPPFEIRCLFQAPDDWVIAEADWVTGEVWLLMVMARDEAGMRAVSDPSKYDVHSAMAKRMFPHIIPDSMTEIEVKKNFKKERDAAKPVTFGVPYQRGPEAIARQLNRAAANEKLDVRYKKEDGAAFIDAYKENFPQAWKFLETQMGLVKRRRYQTSPWGFRRRYPYCSDKRLLNKMQREASNWQIQHGVACTMMSACNAWSNIRKEMPDVPIFMIDILHDATKWLIHKSVLDMAPKIISRVMSDDLVFPFTFTDYPPLRHEIVFYNQWCGKAIEEEKLGSMILPSITPDQITATVPTFPYLRNMIS